MRGWGPRDVTAEESWEDVAHLVFEKNDRDGDGVVTAAELSGALVDRYDRSADGEAARHVAALRILSVSPLQSPSSTSPPLTHATRNEGMAARGACSGEGRVCAVREKRCVGEQF